MAKHRLDIERNAEGHKLAYLAPIDENNSISGGFRIAGPKAWGGSTNLATFKLKTTEKPTCVFVIESTNRKRHRTFRFCDTFDDRDEPLVV